MNDIPAFDWRIISAGVRDEDELIMRRLAWVLGFEAARSESITAIHSVKAPPGNWPETNMEEDQDEGRGQDG